MTSVGFPRKRKLSLGARRFRALHVSVSSFPLGRALCINSLNDTCDAR